MTSERCSECRHNFDLHVEPKGECISQGCDCIGYDVAPAAETINGESVCTEHGYLVCEPCARADQAEQDAKLAETELELGHIAIINGKIIQVESHPTTYHTVENGVRWNHEAGNENCLQCAINTWGTAVAAQIRESVQTATPDTISSPD